MSKARDTQFRGFAKLLWKEIHDEQEAYAEEKLFLTPDAQQAIEKVIAQRAYDLVDLAICHIAMGMSNDSAVMFVPRQNAMNYIPDMTELPKEQDD